MVHLSKSRSISGLKKYQAVLKRCRSAFESNSGAFAISLLDPHLCEHAIDQSSGRLYFVVTEHRMSRLNLNLAKAEADVCAFLFDGYEAHARSVSLVSASLTNMSFVVSSRPPQIQ
jgi:hypothetical protein